MDYKEFIENVKNDLPELLTGELRNVVIDETQVNKLQGRSYQGIVITPAGSSMGVSMNMLPHLQMLNNGTPYEEVLKNLADIITDRYAEHPDFSIDSLKNYEMVKSQLIVQLIGHEGNEEMLQQIPHRDMEDLALVYRLNIHENASGRATTLITYDMLEMYVITLEQLHQDAMESAISNEPFEIKTMAEIISELSGGIFVPEPPIPIYVASNEKQTNGAGVIAYPGFMEEASKLLDGNFYILPSSVHEVILLPENTDNSVSELQEMVESINASDVSPEERLSNQVYHYDSKEKLFERADKYESRIQKQEKGIDTDRSSVLDALHDHQKDCAKNSRKPSPVSRSEEISL